MDPAGACVDDQQCTASDSPRCMNGSCVSAELADRWMCTEPPNKAIVDGTKVHYSFKVVEFVSQMAPANVSAIACRDNDIGCTEPAGMFTDTAGTGLVEFDLPRGFLGFFQVNSSALPAISYLTKPINEDTMDRPLQVPAQSTVDLLAAVSGLTFEPSKGMALVEAFDCMSNPAGGVHFEESSSSATPFYIVDHTPNRDVNVSVYDMVNNVADGGFINIEPSFVSFTARWGVGGPVLGSFNAHIVAGTVTFVDMYL
jgi:hypothetical protein